MPNVTLSIEESSPLLIYSEGWNVGTSRDDRSLDRYSQSGYMFTNSSEADVTFVFTGSTINFFGAKRANYGQYQITVNDEIYPPRDAKSDGEEFFQSNLYSASWLRVLPRSVKMAKSGGGNSSLDLDFVSWIFPVGTDDEEVIVNTIQTSDSAFSYSPSSAWTQNPSNLSSFTGGSGHVTYEPGSSVAFTFEGDAISLFGPVGPSGAPYTAFVDTNGLPDDFTTRKPFFRPNTMLYHRAGLGPGKHTLNITVGDFEFNNLEVNFAIDYAQVYTAPSLGSSSGSSPGGQSDTRARALSTGAVVGITFGSIVGALFVILGIVWLILRSCARRRNRVFHFGFLEKPKSGGKEDIVHPFQYSTLSPGSPDPPVTAAAESLLQTQASYGSLTTPSTAQWPPSAPQSMAAVTSVNYNDPVIRPMASNNTTLSSQTQEITIPPRGLEKIRREQTPQLQPPPVGGRTRQAPAALAAANQAFSPVTEESLYTNGSLPPPMYTYTDPTPSTAAFRTSP